MADDHSHRTSSWIAVTLLILSTVVLGVALIAWSVPLALTGLVLGIAGFGVAAAYRIMDDAY
ncbi:MAG: hypothetical protein M3N21_03935 [Actinomycetota bacterium]|nr:hypothetical protein [Actinomycetota bacterium]